jgi:hypothetical protein
MTISPLRQFVLAAALWLPACFALWALLISPLMWPVAKLTGFALLQILPNVVEALETDGPRFEVVTRLLTEPDASGRVGQLLLTSTPMVYAWCLPLFAGLVMATPLSAARRMLQIAIGFAVLWLVVSWGAFFDALYLLQFRAGPLGEAALLRAGFSAEAVGLGYQFGYLVLPAVTPAALWILLNRVFIESLVGWTGEPDAVSDGLSDSAQDNSNS